MSLDLTKLLFTEKEVAFSLGVSVSFLQKSRSKNRFNILNGKAPKFVKIGNSIRYEKEDLLRFVRELTRHGVSETNVENSDIPLDIVSAEIKNDSSQLNEVNWKNMFAT